MKAIKAKTLKFQEFEAAYIRIKKAEQANLKSKHLSIRKLLEYSYKCKKCEYWNSIFSTCESQRSHSPLGVFTFKDLQILLRCKCCDRDTHDQFKVSRGSMINIYPTTDICRFGEMNPQFKEACQELIRYRAIKYRNAIYRGINEFYDDFELFQKKLSQVAYLFDNANQIIADFVGDDSDLYTAGYRAEESKSDITYSSSHVKRLNMRRAAQWIPPNPDSQFKR